MIFKKSSKPCFHQPQPQIQLCPQLLIQQVMVVHKVVATVKIEGVAVTGIIYTGSDITIISGYMFKTVIAKAGLRKEEFKTANKQALLTINNGC